MLDRKYIFGNEKFEKILMISNLKLIEVPPFGTIYKIHFLPTDPKIFLIYTNFEGERAPKKNAFFVKIFQKVPKNGFLTCFPKIFSRGSENQLCRLKKRLSNVSKFFLKIRPFEKNLDPPLTIKQKELRKHLFKKKIKLESIA